MMQQEAPRFSQAAIEALRNTSAFDDWNREFDVLIKTIRHRVSPRDLRPLLKAGADETRIVTLLAFTVIDSGKDLPAIMKSRRSLQRLANELMSVTNHATRVVNAPEYDGRFWLAVHGLLSWDLVPKAGAIEKQTLTNMRALAQLVKSRGDGLGTLSRKLKAINRVTATRDLLAYVWLSTRHVSRFDAEIAGLLTAAHRAAGRQKNFTTDRIKKFRQRHLPNLKELEMPATLRAGEFRQPRKTSAQCIAEM